MNIKMRLFRGLLIGGWLGLAIATVLDRNFIAAMGTLAAGIQQIWIWALLERLEKARRR